LFFKKFMHKRDTLFLITSQHQIRALLGC
jgi:hypothetical protein